MGQPVKVLHYINQFFAGMGSEEANDTPLAVHDGPVGPGRALQQTLGDDGEVVSTVFAGDDWFVSYTEEAVSKIKQVLMDLRPDLVLAGPAFDAGRYGLACAEVCKAAWELGIPAVTGMHPDNAGISANRQQILAIPTGETPTETANDLGVMARLGLKLVRGEQLGPADVEGYLFTGLRRPHTREKPAAQRATDMLLARIGGRPFVSEIPAHMWDQVPAPKPVASLKDATIALVTSAGIVPRGNPDQQSSAVPRRVLKYDVTGIDRLTVDDWESVHSGFKGYIYNTVNPNYAMPLPAVREAERRGLIKSIYRNVFSVVGGGCPVTDARRMGKEIAQELKQQGIQAAILAST